VLVDNILGNTDVQPLGMVLSGVWEHPEVFSLKVAPSHGVWIPIQHMVP